MKETIGLTLLHFLWQGAAIALLLMLANSMLLRRASANSRYVAACMALALMALGCVFTFVYLTPAAVSPGASGKPLQTISAPIGAMYGETSDAPSVPYLEWLAYAWLAGVVLLAMRSFASWMAAQQLRIRTVKPAPEEWIDRAKRIADRLAIRQAVSLLESGIAEVPSVIGWLRPVVLIPASALAGLDPIQLETLLAHELAHVRRHDYFVNLLQTAVETLLFFHPAVWWVSRVIRAERENCCDDLAVAVCGDPVRYARALAALEQLREQRFALAATDGSLLKRVERLLGRDVSSTDARLRWIPVAILSAFALVITGAQAHPPRPPQPPKAPVAPAAPPPPPAPLVAEAPVPAPEAPPEPPSPPAPPQVDYIESLSSAGLNGLSVDQLIAMKIQGVDGDYVKGMRAQGFDLTPDQLVAFKIQGVTADYIKQLKTQGWQLTPDQLIAFKIQGVDPQEVGQFRAMGFQMNAEEAIAARIHGITSDYVKAWQNAGFKTIDFQRVVALKVQGADPSMSKDYASLGFHDLDVDRIIALKVMDVTPEFVREVQKRGFKDLTIDQIIQLRQMNIIPPHK